MIDRGQSDELLDHYQAELRYLREMGESFARDYPRIAGRLELGPDESADPHVERLIESFAFLTARMQLNLRDDFPELTGALLELLCPHLVRPMPSASIARFTVDPDQGKLTTGHEIARGTMLYADTTGDETCRFRTTYPVTLWPVEIAEAGFESPDRFDFGSQVATVLRLRIAASRGSLAELELDQLRFYINEELSQAADLYELLTAQRIQTAILPEGSTRPIFLPEPSVRPVGFTPEEAILPHPDRGHDGYRILQEYFAFPRKFLFLDIAHLGGHRSARHFDLLFLLRRMPHQRLSVDRETFQTGCTPVVNLFVKSTEPVRLDHLRHEYRLIPDMRREKTTEIYSILSVSTAPRGNEKAEQFQPFYSFRHETAGRDGGAYWLARRVPTGRAEVPGTEMRISFLDLDANVAKMSVQTVFATTLCTNRRLAEQLPMAAELQIEEAAPLSRIELLHLPTRAKSPPTGGATQWRLVSHLSLNHLSLTSGADGRRALQEILRLYGGADELSVQQQIQGIIAMRCRNVVRRLDGEAWRGFCRGTEVEITLDEELFVGTNAFLFASVLNHFLALYATINSFTQLVLRSARREGEWHRWPPLSGEHRLI